MSNDYKNYLHADTFYYLVKSKYEKYIITEEFITNALYIKPEVFTDIEKEDELYSTQGFKQILGNDFISEEIEEKYTNKFDGFIKNKDDFLEEINKSNNKIKPLKLLNICVDDVGFVIDDENKKVIAVNWVEILQPALNLSEILFNCCADDEDKTNFYFDYKNELLYVLLYSAQENKYYFIMAIKPMEIPNEFPVDKILKQVELIQEYEYCPKKEEK